MKMKCWMDVVDVRRRFGENDVASEFARYEVRKEFYKGGSREPVNNFRIHTSPSIKLDF